MKRKFQLLGLLASLSVAGLGYGSWYIPDIEVQILVVVGAGLALCFALLNSLYISTFYAGTQFAPRWPTLGAEEASRRSRKVLAVAILILAPVPRCAG